MTDTEFAEYLDDVEKRVKSGDLPADDAKWPAADASDDEDGEDDEPEPDK